MGDYTCPDCGRPKTKRAARCRSCGARTWKRTDEIRQRISRSKRGSAAWNKGLTKADRPSLGRQGHSPDLVTREKMRQAKFGKVGPNAGRTKETHPGVARMAVANSHPVGSQRIANGHIQVKRQDGNWDYHARVIWEQANGTILRGILIHHRNENPFDDSLENLQAMTRADHVRVHKPRLGTGHVCI
jgi:hypothetical protein